MKLLEDKHNELKECEKEYKKLLCLNQNRIISSVNEKLPQRRISKGDLSNIILFLLIFL